MQPRSDIFRLPGYLPFWLANTVSGFGSAITLLAVQVLVVDGLHGGATQVGLLNAARWLPYMLFGLVVGALVDRIRRKPVLVATDLGCAALLAVVPALWLAGWLSLPILLAVMALFGVLRLAGDAAGQSFLPRLVPASHLLAANARLDQGAAAAQTAGPALAGGLVSLIGAPLAVLLDAASYLASALVILRIPVDEPAPAARQGRHLGREIAEGLRFVYRHPTLAPFALATHGWFFCHSMLTTVFVPFVLLGLGRTPFDLGLALAAAGTAGLFGSLLATRLGHHLGAGRAIIACRAAMPLAWAVIALAPAASAWTLAMLATGQALHGFAMGAENANEMGYRQAVTPDAVQGRMNTTMRSINRAMNVIGAPLGGLLADAIGYRPTLWIAIAAFALVPLCLAATPFRHARHASAT